MARVFISYSREDSEIARRVANDLRNYDHSTWLDYESLTPGEDWRDAITNAITRADAFILLVSPSSWQSRFVRAEWEAVRDSRRAIPTLVNGADFKDLPFELSHIQAVDLNVDYERGIRLLAEAVTRVSVSQEPTLAETIDIAKLASDIKRQVIDELKLTGHAPKNPGDTELIDEKLVFVITSFQPDMEPIYEAISDAAAVHTLRAERVKDVVGDHRITETMLSMLRRARFIVADLTHERPNVYFELGYARALGKEVVTILREGTERHFDVYDWSYISYTDSRPLERALVERFSQMLGGGS